MQILGAPWGKIATHTPNLAVREAVIALNTAIITIC